MLLSIPGIKERNKFANQFATKKSTSTKNNERDRKFSTIPSALRYVLHTVKKMKCEW